MACAAIRMVCNDDERVRYVNYTERSQFDPQKRTETPYKVKVAA